MPMPVNSWTLGPMLLLALSTAAADSPSPQPAPPSPPRSSSSSSSAPDMGLIEFLGSVETDGNSGQAVLTEIDTALLPESPETPRHEKK
ncbi:MAG TPA: hypothetical protein VEI74_07475 [Candidatus Methylomirabilis sp.]|nr:hypothetical protein [Candidatus Methylomirabilis sp.]